jgi:hypothetical protein
MRTCTFVLTLCWCCVVLQSRRLYCGNLPVGIGLMEQLLVDFLNATMAAAGCTSVLPIIQCYFNKKDARFCVRSATQSCGLWCDSVSPFPLLFLCFDVLCGSLWSFVLYPTVSWVWRVWTA